MPSQSQHRGSNRLSRIVAAAGVCFGVLVGALFVDLILDPGAGAEEAQLLSVLGALLGAGGAFTSWRDLGRGSGRRAAVGLVESAASA